MPVPKRALPYWNFFSESAERHRLDAYLLAAVADRESLCGKALNPEGPAGVGDNGWALGIMQVDRRFHGIWAGMQLPDGSFAWESPRENIEYGAGLLADNFRLFRSWGADSDIPAIASYNASFRTVREALGGISRHGEKSVPREAILWACDAVTTGRDYVTSVLARRAAFWAAAAVKSVPPPEKP